MTAGRNAIHLQPGGAWKVLRHGVVEIPDVEAEAGLLREVAGVLPPTFQEPGFAALDRAGETVPRAEEEYQAVAGKSRFDADEEARYLMQLARSAIGSQQNKEESNPHPAVLKALVELIEDDGAVENNPTARRSKMAGLEIVLRDSDSCATM